MISRVGLIYFPDQQSALTGRREALRPGGRISAVIYSTADRNGFFSVPIGIIRRQTQLPPPAPRQPEPFSLGAPGVAEEALARAGFRDITADVVPSPLRMASAADCLRIERESFGALHQMLAGLPQTEQEDVWAEIGDAFAQFEGQTASPARVRCWSSRPRGDAGRPVRLLRAAHRDARRVRRGDHFCVATSPPRQSVHTLIDSASSARDRIRSLV